MENMEKMKVNAQVTAVTTILESVGCLVIFITWAFITKFSGYTTLIQSILLYFVLLPYAFLMNTSQNKARIIEHGWTNVIRNIFNIRTSNSPPKEKLELLFRVFDSDQNGYISSHEVKVMMTDFFHLLGKVQLHFGII